MNLPANVNCTLSRRHLLPMVQLSVSVVQPWDSKIVQRFGHFLENICSSTLLPFTIQHISFIAVFTLSLIKDNTTFGTARSSMTSSRATSRPFPQMYLRKAGSYAAKSWNCAPIWIYTKSKVNHTVVLISQLSIPRKHYLQIDPPHAAVPEIERCIQVLIIYGPDLAPGTPPPPLVSTQVHSQHPLQLNHPSISHQTSAQLQSQADTLHEKCIFADSTPFSVSDSSHSIRLWDFHA